MLGTSKILSQTKTKEVVQAVPEKPPISQNLLVKVPTNELPIKVERIIQFTTEEASWIDVDVSPDGKTLLCSFLGNLYSLPSTGGTATQLTRGLAINRYPVWSPDGKYFAYISDASGFIQVHIRDSAGNFHTVLGEPKNALFPTDLRILWFPDSKEILIGEKIYDLYGNASSLVKEVNYLLGFSADGKYMYYLEWLSRNTTALIRLDRVTRERNKLLFFNDRFDKVSPYRAKISCDGNWVSFIKFENIDYGNGESGPADSLMLLDIKTGKETLLASLGIKFTGYIQNQHYCFSNDSRYLFIGYGGKIHRIEVNTGKNQVIPFSADVKVDMGELDYHTFPVSLDSFEVKYTRSAKRSPDGKQLVFSALNRVYILDLPNGKPRVLVNQPFGQFQPSFSSDGKWICYVSWSDTTGGHLWKVSPDGSKAEQLTTIAAQYQHPSWSPDGKMVVVAKGDNKLGRRWYPGEGQIQVITIADKSVKQIADTVPLYNEPVFSSDGTQILYKPNQTWANDKIWPKLVSLDLATNILRELIAARLIMYEDHSIQQILLSPDDRYVVFMFNEDLYLAPLINIRSTQFVFDEKEALTLIRFARGAIDPVWEDGGKKLSWLNANQYCTIDPRKIMQATMHLQPNQTIEGLPKTKIIDVDISPDQTIAIHLKAPRQYGHGMIALKNVRIITMRGGDVIENGTIIVKNGRIICIGQTSKTEIPKGANVVDLRGKTIVPGFIDMHSHMHYAIPPDVFYQQTWERLLDLSYGITTRRNPNGSVDEFGYNELTETGQMLGPRAFSVGRAVYETYNLNNINEAKVIVNNRVKMGANYIKQYAQPTRLQRQLLLHACKQAGVNMTNEVEKEPLDCIGHIKDGSTGVEHNPIWGEIYDDVIKLVAKSGCYLCPTVRVCYGFKEGKHYFHKLYGQEFISRSARFMSYNYREQLAQEIQEDELDTGFLQQSRIDARVRHAGGKIVMGGHGEDQGIGSHWEIWALQMGGLTNHEALETATINSAEAMGMQNDLGSVELGKIADLIILDKNPLENIHNTNTIKYVMKAGVLYDSETLDEIWPQKKKCPEWRMKSDANR